MIDNNSKNDCFNGKKIYFVMVIIIIIFLSCFAPFGLSPNSVFDDLFSIFQDAKWSKRRVVWRLAQ